MGTERRVKRWGAVKRSALAAVAGVVGVAGLTACVPPPPMTVTVVQSRLDIPWDLGWLPNGTMLVTERGFGLSAVTNGQRRLVWRPADLLVASEAGMMSLAIDPGFGFFSRDIFVCFASTAGGAPNVRIARLTLDAAITTVTARTDILTGAPINPEGELGRHSGCRLKFGPDNALWVGTGDAAIGTAPQNPWMLGGKVLRITKTGAPAPGNMGIPFDPRIQSYGHRNVQGIAFRSNGQAFAVEHGPGCEDEVNELVTGANYGWDPVPRLPGDPSYNENTPMTDLVRHPNAKRPVWNSGCPTIAPSGGTFVYGAKWGQWNGGLVMAVLKGSHLRMVRLTPDGRRTEATSVALTNRGRLRTAVVGPDGALYVTTSNGGAQDVILRIDAHA
jgi:glucose/arabinose dehydrogenase